MTEIIRLAPHDPIPTGLPRQVVVLHRFDEDAPRETITQIALTGQPDEIARMVGPDGHTMGLDEAIEQAKRVAAAENVPRIYVVDRTAGAREQDILQHGGDHSVHMENLVDSDLEDGEHGPDMRDVRNQGLQR